jgi:hypothetical protein
MPQVSIAAFPLSHGVVLPNTPLKFFKSPPTAAHTPPHAARPLTSDRATTLRAAWRPCSVVARSEGRQQLEGVRDGIVVGGADGRC